MNQGKLEEVKQEMAKVNMNIIGISEPKWTGMGEFNSDDHYIQIGKGVHQGCILSPCLFNLYAECIMRNSGLEEAQAGMKITRRNINNLRYADDTPLWQN